MGMQRERSGRHAAMGADRADTAPQFEALANHVGQLVQNLGQITAGALLQQHRGNKEVNIERRNALRELLQSHFNRQTQIVLFKGPAEFARDRLRKFAVNHFERYRESVTGAHGAGDEFERLRKQRLQSAADALLLRNQTYPTGPAASTRPITAPSQLRNRQQKPGRDGGAEKGHPTKMDQARRRPFQAGLFQKDADFGPQFITVHHHLGELVFGFYLHLHDRLRAGRGGLPILALFCLGVPNRRALILSTSEDLKYFDTHEPRAHTHGPNDDQD